MPDFRLVVSLIASLAALGAGGWVTWLQQDPVQPPGRESQSVAGLAAQDHASDEPPKDELVKDWKDPDFVLLVTGQLTGYIEPCGCTGLTNQKGGLLRRYDLLELLRGRGWRVIPVDAGEQIHPDRRGQQTILKLQTTYQALCRLMGYRMIGFGASDLKVSGTDLGQTMMDKMDQTLGNPFTSANVTVLDESLVNRVQMIDAGRGLRIAVTSVIGASKLADLPKNLDGIETIPPDRALAQIAPVLQGSGAALKVLFCHGTMEECTQLAGQFPLFDFVIVTGTTGDPDLLPVPVTSGNHTTRMIQVGAKGMFAGLIGFWSERPNPADRAVYERVPLDARFENVAAFGKQRTVNELNPMERMFYDYQKSLENLYTNPQKFQDIAFRKHPSGYRFVGSQACKDCHEEEFDIWKDGVDGQGGPHFRATRDLTDPGERTWVARNFDPECLSCHVTGWNPKEYYPYESGYYDLARDKLLHGNGCENCHGPGSQHVAAENDEIAASEDDKKKYQLEMRLTIKQARENHCMTCHDLDNSPDFFLDGAFDRYWSKIEHGDGKDPDE